MEEVVRNTTTNPIAIPHSTDATLLAAFNKKDIKAMRIILDVVKDHAIPHISAKDHAHEMWSALTGLFESTNENKKMVLREKLKNIKMVKGEVCMAYLTRISQVRDELATVGVVVTGPKLVRTALNGVTAPWAVFVQGLVARENLPDWDRVCDDFVQEETRRGFLQSNGSTSRGDDEDVALTSKGKKKSKKGPKKGWAKKQQDGQKKDMRTVKCFACDPDGDWWPPTYSTGSKQLSIMAVS